MLGAFKTYRTVQLTIREQLFRSNEKQFQGGLVFKARRLFVSLNFRPRVIKKRGRSKDLTDPVPRARRCEGCEDATLVVQEVQGLLEIKDARRP